MEWDLGPNQRKGAATSQTKFAHHSANKPKMALLGPINTTRGV